MFGRKRESSRKRGSFLPFVIFRLLLSCVIFAVFAFGVYQAFRYFSGVDPLKLDPQTSVVTFLESDQTVGTVSRLLGFDLGKSLSALLPKTSGVSKTPVSSVASSPAPDSRDPGGGNKPSGRRLLTFAIVADSHMDGNHLKQALAQAKEKGAKLIIGLGDYSDVGTPEQLQKAQTAFTSAGLPFYVTAGDHDLWDARDKGQGSTSEFSQVFGPPYGSFSDSNIRFILLSNGDNYDGVDILQMKWLKEILADGGADNGADEPKLIFVFLHEPLYHPSSDHMMGKVTPGLVSQAKEIAQVLQEGGVAEVFAGDIHAFTRYEDPTTHLKMTTLGAVTEERNTEKPSFVMVDVYESGGYNVEKVEIK